MRAHTGYKCLALGLLLAPLCLAWSQQNPKQADATQAAPPSSSPTVAQNPAAENISPASQPAAEAIAGASSAVLKVTTRMVLVDAVVIGSDGKPVAGLKPEDFQLFENGVRQTIKAFGATVPPPPNSPVPPPHPLTPGLFTNTIDFHREQGAPIIILVDALNTVFVDQVYGRDQLLEFLKKNSSRRNIAIYVLGQRLNLLQDFTDDPVLLRRAVGGVEGDQYASQHPVAQQGPLSTSDSITLPPNPILDSPAAIVAKLKVQIASFEGSINRYYRDRAIEITLQAFRTIARNAAAIPGRKELIWLSASFPLNFNIANSTPYVGQFQETSNLLADAQVSVYPVDVRGLVAFHPLVSDAGMSQLNASHAAMYFVASRTGGTAFYERNDLDNAIATAAAEGSTFYVLGYYPTNKDWRGQFRSVEVKVRKRGLHVRCRKGYFATEPVKNPKVLTNWSQTEFLRTLAKDPGPARMLPFFAHVEPPDQSHSQLFVDISVDPHSVLFANQSKGYRQAILKFITVVTDDHEKVITTKFDNLNANLSPATFSDVMKTSLAIRQKIDLVPGKYKLRIGVRDAQTDLIGTVIATVQVPGSNK